MDRPSWGLLERDGVLEGLRTKLRQVDAGQGAPVLIGGEAGADKSSLLRRFATMARPSAVVLVGHCEALSTPRMLGPLCDIADAEREAESAVALIERIESGPELAMAYGTPARLRGTILRDNTAILLGEKAVALAERVGASETRIDALTTVGEVRLAHGEIAADQDRLDLGLRLSTDAGLDELFARTYISLGYGFAACGRPERAIHHWERGIAFCVERDLDLPLQHITTPLANVHVGLANWDRARQLSNAVLDRDTAPVDTRFFALLATGRMQARLGDPGAAALLDAALEIALDSRSIAFPGPTRAARAEAASLAGDPKRTAAEARAAYDLAVARVPQLDAVFACCDLLKDCEAGEAVGCLVGELLS